MKLRILIKQSLVDDWLVWLAFAGYVLMLYAIVVGVL
jgi:hypothetical protein